MRMRMKIGIKIIDFYLRIATVLKTIFIVNQMLNRLFKLF